MDASKVRDQQSLGDWLKGRSREDAIAIASRAATRVFVFFAQEMEEDWARTGDYTSLPILRCNLTSGVARKFPTPEVREAAAAGAAAARMVAAAEFVASRTAIAAARGAAAARTAVAARTATTTAAISVAAWDQIRADARILDGGDDPFYFPLWQGASPEWFVEGNTRTRAIWAKDPEVWAFWARWWDGVIAGRPIDWAIQKRIALIPETDWEMGPSRIAAVVRGIEAEMRLDSPDVAKAPKPDSATHLVRDRRVTRIQAEGVAAQIADAIERYHSDTGQNELPNGFEALRGIPPVLMELGRKLADANTTEDMLRDEIQRLNARVLQLEADLKEAKQKTLTGVIAKNFAEQTGKSLGDWKMWGAFIGSVGYLSGVPSMVMAVESIADSVLGIFGDKVPHPPMIEMPSPPMIDAPSSGVTPTLDI